MTQQAEPSIWVKKNNPEFLECSNNDEIIQYNK